jgi:hypothetical protein
LLTLYYAFVTSAGTFDVLSWHTDYYDLLAEAFGKGQLHLTVVPKARLLAKADPFNYRWVDYWLWDASLYKARYYLYWGPVPALCVLLFKTITRYADTVYDQWLVLAFMLGRLYAGAALIVLYARARATRVPSWAVHLSIIAFAVASPTPYFMARPVIYEASIAAGQCFAFCGALAAYYGILHPLVRTRAFVLAGFCLGCGLGSRGSLFVVAPLMVLGTSVIANRRAGYPLRPILRDLAAMALPVVCAVVLYGIYNELRFDSVREFGLKYQLTSRPFGVKNRFLLPNLVSYLGTELKWSCQFPFVRLPMERDLPDFIRWPSDYDIGDWDKGERAGGILLATSICWLWLIWLGRAAYSGMVASARKLMRLPGRRLVSQGDLWWLWTSCTLVLALAPASRMWMATMRFLEDASGGILLGAIAAGFWLLDRARRSQQRALRVIGPTVYAALCVYSIGVGAALGFTGHMDNFNNENPALFESLVKHVSVCQRGAHAKP